MYKVGINGFYVKSQATSATYMGLIEAGGKDQKLQFCSGKGWLLSYTDKSKASLVLDQNKF